MRRRIERLGLAEDTVAGLQGAGIATAGQLFEASPLALMSACDLDLNGTVDSSYYFTTYLYVCITGS